MLSLLAQQVLPVIGWFNDKVSAWQKARAHPPVDKPPSGKMVVWMHCSSLGEFEQGRPVWEGLRERYPDAFLLLSFFSSSGYDRQKTNPTSDRVVLLPLDTPSNARQWMDQYSPDLILWVKYDFWFHYWIEAHRRQIPVLLFAARFRKDQFLAKSWATPFREVILQAHAICVQDEASLRILEDWQYPRAVVAGDPRIDRVMAVTAEPMDDPWIEAFASEQKVMICGSVWDEDLDLLLPVLRSGLLSDWKWIFAPHDMAETRIDRILMASAAPSTRYTKREKAEPGASRILVLDTIGQLNKVYRYGAIAYVGGGFGRSVHNLLEPAAYGQPVLFGPHHQKFPEAIGLIRSGGGFEVNDGSELEGLLALLKGEAYRESAGQAARQWLAEHQGATIQVLGICQSILDE
ncbi:MAG: hypothetical protein K9I85_09955 [Saprospiraceae bacterium]|nr:hypothetical protein [Saprospiraceae bacterium]